MSSASEFPRRGALQYPVGDALPYRGTFGAPRPRELAALALPPNRMPARQGLRPLKAWRYVGVYGPELMLCLCVVRVGPARQSFWAIWDRVGQKLLERTVMGRGSLELHTGRATLNEPRVQLELSLSEAPGVETVSPTARSYAWTRKQGGVATRGELVVDGLSRELSGRAVIDDTAAYYDRHTRWRWCAGVGVGSSGEQLAWNLVSGINDSPSASERTIWIDGVPREPEPVEFADDLSRVGNLWFTAEASRERREQLVVVRSSYRQPFGAFWGALPGGIELLEGYGVMEAHEAWW